MTVALDWHVGYDCRIKHRLTLMQLAPLVHADGGVTALAERLKATPDGPVGGASAGSDPALATSGAVIGGAAGALPEPRPGLHRTSPSEAGLVETVIALPEARRRADALRRFRRTCRDCPANGPMREAPGGGPGPGGKAGFGCFGTLTLPITASSEQALMLVIVLIMEGGDHVDSAAAAPIRHIWDNGLTGDNVSALRGRPGFFELDCAVVARVGPFLEKRDISSDQVFEVFLSAATFPLEYAVLFSGFLAEFPRLAAVTDATLATDAAPLISFFRSLLLAQDLGVDTHLTPLVPDPRADTSEEPALTHESIPAMELGLMDEA